MHLARVVVGCGFQLSIPNKLTQRQPAPQTAATAAVSTISREEDGDIGSYRHAVVAAQSALFRIRVTAVYVLGS